MAQLIKLQDYISRYSQDIYLYPSRFVRLKKQQWEGIKQKWENGSLENDTYLEDESELESRKDFFVKMKNWIRPLDHITEIPPEKNEQEMNLWRTQTQYAHLKSEDALKKHFLDQLLPFQIKWASSTLLEKSFVEKEYYRDPTLKFLLQRFPDTFLVLYKPIFLLKKAPVEAELIILTPGAVYCISFLEAEENAVFAGSKDRFWIKRTKKKESKVLNPLISLNRTEKIVKTLFSLYEIDFPVQKWLVSRNGFFDYPFPPYELNFVEKRNFEEWFMSLRNMKSPLKHMQLKAAQILLQYCQTTSVRRLEWESDKLDEFQDE